MRITTQFLLVALAGSAALTATACSTEPASENEANIGSLRMNLTSQSASGASYRLASTVFSVTGPESTTIASEDFPDSDTANASLQVGDYEIAIEDGWVLEKLEDGSYVPVVATLRGTPTQDFSITEGATTNVAYVFRTATDEVIFGTGDLSLSFSVEEVPEAWTCNLNYYGTADGCDCDCGTADPDCDEPAAPVYGCATGEICSDEGLCELNPLCGNGTVDAAESCDDGNNVDGDGCSATCALEPACGDGVRDPGEQCDDGNVVDGDGCSSACQAEGIPAEWTCNVSFYGAADGCDCTCGAVDPDCEDPSQQIYGCVAGQTCDDAGLCAGEPTCGNGTIDTGEQCDDGGIVAGDGCGATCLIESACGNGIVEGGEACDDGNTTPGDGCSEQCVLENIPAGWACAEAYYGAGDGCDCACGAPDPDCEDPAAQLYNCQAGESCSAEGLCVAP